MVRREKAAEQITTKSGLEERPLSVHRETMNEPRARSYDRGASEQGERVWAPPALPVDLFEGLDGLEGRRKGGGCESSCSSGSSSSFVLLRNGSATATPSRLCPRPDRRPADASSFPHWHAAAEKKKRKAPKPTSGNPSAFGFDLTLLRGKELAAREDSEMRNLLSTSATSSLRISSGIAKEVRVRDPTSCGRSTLSDNDDTFVNMLLQRGRGPNLGLVRVREPCCPTVSAV